MTQHLPRHHDLLGTSDWFFCTTAGPEVGPGLLKEEAGVAAAAAPAKNATGHVSRAWVTVAQPHRGSVPVSPATQ